MASSRITAFLVASLSLSRWTMANTPTPIQIADDNRTWENVIEQIKATKGERCFADALARRLLQLGDSRTSPMLSELANDRANPAARACALSVAAQGYHPGLLTLFAEAASDEREPLELRATCLNPGLRNQGDAKGAKVAIALMSHAHPQLRTSAYFALAGIGGDDALTALASRLETDHSYTRVSVVLALNAMRDPRAGTALLALLDPTKESKEIVRNVVLAMTTHRVTAAAQKILPLLADDDELTRNNAAEYFAVCPVPEAASGMAEALAKQTDLNVTRAVENYLRNASLSWLRRWRLERALAKHGKHEEVAQP